MSQVVLDELEGDAGIEQVRGDRVAEPVAGVAAIEAGQVAVADEQRLDLALPERAVPSVEQGLLGGTLPCSEVAAEQPGRGREERLLGPRPALQALDDYPAPREIHVLAVEKGHLPHAECVVVDQREEGAVAEVLDRREKCPDLELGEVAGQALRWPKDPGQRRDEVRT